MQQHDVDGRVNMQTILGANNSKFSEQGKKETKLKIATLNIEHFNFYKLVFNHDKILRWKWSKI